MSRDWRLYWGDILVACRKVQRYASGLDRQAFQADEKTYDAVLRNLEIIGEAVKQLPPHVCATVPDVEWRKIAGLRDIVAHRYFGIDDVILWDIVSAKIPALLATLGTVDIHSIDG